MFSKAICPRQPPSGPWRRQGRCFSCHSARNQVMRPSQPPNRPPRMAVIGSGPAGFYTAYRVMSKLPGTKIDMYEALPVPFGLVRYGVAPDHPEVKNCQDKFEEIASSPDFAFIGNVSVGQPNKWPQQCSVSLDSLMNHYDAILFSYGASEDKKLGIAGESTLDGIYSAREFVGWYNGLPDFAGLSPDLSRGEEAVVIGQGNVALDVTRILLEDIDKLRKTDITEHALAVLSRSRIKRVRVVGRRGPMQAAFTIKEARELMNLPGVAFHAVDRSLIPDDLKSLPRASKRLMEVLIKGAPEAKPERSMKSWSLDSCLSPKHFLGDQISPTHVASTQFDVTQLDTPHDPHSSVHVTNDTTLLPADVVFRSVGYKSISLPGFEDIGAQFDTKRGILSNDGLGRVTRLVSDKSTLDPDSQRIPGVYCAGWLKRGPTGVIASTMQDAFTTGDAIIHDWAGGKQFLTSAEQAWAPSGWDGVKHDLEGDPNLATSWQQWRKIDAAERDRGRSLGKEREKFTTVEEMLAVSS